MGHAHHEWLQKATTEIADDYDRLRATAGTDPQRAGHGGESTWRDLLDRWLPPAYAVATRKYIIPEVGEDEAFETDLVVFQPSYPELLRDREEVMSSGVAAAFSVKLTLDASGVADAVKKAVALRRATARRGGTARGELLPVFPFGLLAHSSAWKADGSDPEGNIEAAIHRAQGELDDPHPRDLLDYVCVADLNIWMLTRMPYMPPHALQLPVDQALPAKYRAEGCAMTALMRGDRENSPAPVAVLVSCLFQRLSYSDPSVRPVADGFRMTNTLGAARGQQEHWDLDRVFSPEVKAELPRRGFSRSDRDWFTLYS